MSFTLMDFSIYLEPFIYNLYHFLYCNLNIFYLIDMFLEINGGL